MLCAVEFSLTDDSDLPLSRNPINPGKSKQWVENAANTPSVLSIPAQCRHGETQGHGLMRLPRMAKVIVALPVWEK